MRIPLKSISLFSFILTVILLPIINTNPFVLASNDSINIPALGNWVLIILLIFLIIYSLYFFRSLSKFLDEIIDESYFWVLNLALSIIITNFVYFIMYPDQLDSNFFLNSTTYYILLILFVIFLYSLLCENPILHDLRKDLLDQNLNELFSLNQIKQFIYDPFNITALVLSPISIIDFSKDGNILIFIFKIITIVLISLTVEDILRVVWRYFGSDYLPKGISKIIRLIIFGVLIQLIRECLKPAYNLIMAKIKIDMATFLPYLGIQVIILPTIWEMPSLSIYEKIIFSIGFLFVSALIICLFGSQMKANKNYRKKQIYESLLGAIIFSSTVLLIDFVIVSIYYIFDYIYTIDMQSDNVKYFFILMISFLVLIILYFLDPHLVPRSEIRDGERILSVKTYAFPELNGAWSMSELNMLNIKWELNEENCVLFAVDRAANMQSNMNFVKQIIKEIAEPLSPIKNDKNDPVENPLKINNIGKTRLGLICTNDGLIEDIPKEKISEIVFSDECESLLKKLDKDLSEDNSTDAPNYSKSLCAAFKICDDDNNNGNKQYKYSIIFISDFYMHFPKGERKDITKYYIHEDITKYFEAQTNEKVDRNKIRHNIHVISIAKLQNIKKTGVQDPLSNLGIRWIQINKNQLLDEDKKTLKDLSNSVCDRVQIEIALPDSLSIDQTKEKFIEEGVSEINVHVKYHPPKSNRSELPGVALAPRSSEKQVKSLVCKLIKA
jgi:hypothetical protein